MIAQLFIVWAICQVVASSLPTIGLKQRPTGERVFIEVDTGREVFFHGVNAIVKGIPYIPETEIFDIDTSLSDKDHETLADLGVNIYRLGAMWKGFEPQRGEYNESYANTLMQIVAAAEKRGIYTLLDMHQDVYSEKFCGEGVPDWAAISSYDNDPAKRFPAPLQEPFTALAADGYPTREDCSKFNWPSYYQTYASASACDNLYRNVDGLLDSWAQYWTELARRTTSSSTPHSSGAIIGYELINEPYPGDIFSEPKLLIPGIADRERLQPAYDTLATAIRSVGGSNDQRLIFFAAITWDDIIAAGFQHPPGGAEEAHRSVFAFHYYTPPQANHFTYFFTRLNDAKRLQVASMLTEFERSTPDNGNSSDPYVQTASAADYFMQSWTMWEYKTFCKESSASSTGDSQQAEFGSCKTGYGGHLIWDDEGNYNVNAARKLARTFPHAVAGNTSSFAFDAETGDFSLEYAVDTNIKEPTIIFAHGSLNYPQGVGVNVFPVNALSWEQPEVNKLYFTPTKKTLYGDRVRIILTRK